MSTIIIGSPDNPDRYFYNPKSPRDTSNRVEPDRAPAQLPNIPDNLITDQMRLQNIVDNKNLFKNEPSPDRPGMNLYQDKIQDFRTSTPERMQVYAERFPITQFMMETPRAIAENSLFGNLISSLNQSFTGAKNKASNFSKGLFPQGLFPGLGPTVQGFAEDLSNVPSGIKKDMSNFKGLFRDLTGTKKNTSEDLAPGSIENVIEGSVTGDKFRKNLEQGDPLGLFDKYNYYGLKNPYKETLQNLNCLMYYTF